MALPIIEIDKLALDNTIKPEEDHYAADNGIVRSEFYSTGNRVVFEKNGRRFTWTPQEMKYVDAFGIEDTIYTVQDVPLETKANYARFNRSMPDIDDWFIMENNQLKHQILVQGFQRDPLEFLTAPIDFAIGGQIHFDADLRIFADGEEQWDTFETEGSIFFMDQNDEIVFNLPPVVAYDSKIPERAMTGGKYRVHKNADGVLAFQFVLDNEWIASTDRVYPIVIDPTVVVNSAYDTSGNGGRKLVQLSNGWLVTMVYESGSINYYRFYKSEDNGATWTQLTLLYDNAYYATGASLTSYGTNIYVVFPSNDSSKYIRFVKFDATTVANTNRNSSSIVIDTQSTLGTTSITVDSNGVLHTSWASKNSTYPNSFNIRYSKSTDGGVTWASPTQITAYNNSTYNHTQPSIVVKNDNNPVITWLNAYGSPINYMVYGSRWTGSNWSSPFVVYDGGTYTQSNPCAVVDSNGVIHVVWYGTDTTDTTRNNIRYSKSTDGGATWSVMAKLTSGNSYHQYVPSIIVDKNNKLYVFWHGIDPTVNGTYYNIRKITNDGTGWSSIQTLTSNTTDSALYPSAIASDTLIGWIYKDSQANAVQFDKIVLNAPPTAPTGLTRSNFDATTSAVFSWTFNDGDSGDSQSAYELEYQENVAGASVNTTGKVASTTPSHTFISNTFTNGKEYKWRVRTYDSQSEVSPWSEYVVFNCGSAPTATVTNPTSGATINGSTYTVQGSYSQAQNIKQKSFRFILWDSAGTSIVQDSGTIIGTSNAKTFENLANNTTYRIQLEVTDQNNTVGQSAKVSFSTSFVTPKTPSVTLSQDSDNASITVAVTNPAPSAGEPTVVTNEIYRRKVGDTDWTKVGEALTSFTDHQCPAGDYQYSAIAVGNNGTKSPISDIQVITVAFTGWWIVDRDTHEKFQFAYNVPMSQIALEEERQELRTFSSKPFVRYGAYSAERGSLAGLKTASGTSSRDQVRQLQALVAKRKPFLLKNNRGDVWTVNLFNLRRMYSVGLTEESSIEWVEV